MVAPHIIASQCLRQSMEDRLQSNGSLVVSAQPASKQIHARGRYRFRASALCRSVESGLDSSDAIGKRNDRVNNPCATERGDGQVSLRCPSRVFW